MALLNAAIVKPISYFEFEDTNGIIRICRAVLAWVEEEVRLLRLLIEKCFGATT
jgi:hypothetical protein